jgi:hypothetical protein
MSEQIEPEDSGERETSDKISEGIASYHLPSLRKRLLLKPPRALEQYILPPQLKWSRRKRWRDGEDEIQTLSEVTEESISEEEELEEWDECQSEEEESHGVDKAMGKKDEELDTDTPECGEMEHFTVEEIVRRVEEVQWRVVIEEGLRKLSTLSGGYMEDEVWQEKKKLIDHFWADISTYAGSGLLVDRPYTYWEMIQKNEDHLVGNIATALMSAASSEASCERGFSILRRVVTKSRRKLGLQKLRNILTIRGSS